MVNFKQMLTEDNTEPNTEFLKQLRSKLPEFFTKDKYGIDTNGKEVVVEAGGFDIQKFQESLSKHNVNEITDGYTLNFVGKKYAELKTGKPTTTVVIPDVQHNTQQKNSHSENVFLTGDNLDVLKHLQRAYTNSIDMIYIDPPYNTGTDGFVYNDKFDLSDEDLRNTLNMNEDEIKKLRLLDNRSSHSAWLTFMFPRLKIAQQLLKETGVIFVSIDDNEQANLKLLMDEIFGESSFITQFIWTKTATPPALSNKTRSTTEYVLTFEKKYNAHKYFGSLLDNGTVSLLNGGNNYRDVVLPIGSARFGFMKNGVIKANDFGRVKLLEDINIENNLNLNPVKINAQVRWTQSKIDDEVKDGTYFTFNTKKMNPRFQRVSSNGFKTPNTALYKEVDVDTNEEAVKYLSELGISNVFDYPKPTSLIKYLVNMVTYDNLDAIILDFFAGSSTTADAVMQLNAEDGGNRKWILNTLDEKTPDDSAAQKDGYLTIDEISRERIKRAGNKIQKEHPELDSFDVGFKHYYVKEMNTNTIDKIVDFDPNSIQILTEDVVSEFAGDAVKLGEYYEKSDKDKVNPKFATVVDTGASGEDTILQTWLINDGYKLDVPVKTLELVHHNVHYVEDGAMAYIIDQFTQEDVEELLNLIGTQQLNVKTIIVFGYSFDFATMTSLKNNVKTVLDGVRVEVRY